MGGGGEGAGTASLAVLWLSNGVVVGCEVRYVGLGTPPLSFVALTCPNLRPR